MWYLHVDTTAHFSSSTVAFDSRDCSNHPVISLTTTWAREVTQSPLSVCLFVCLSVRFHSNFWTEWNDLDFLCVHGSWPRFFRNWRSSQRSRCRIPQQRPLQKSRSKVKMQLCHIFTCPVRLRWNPEVWRVRVRLASQLETRSVGPRSSTEDSFLYTVSQKNDSDVAHYNFNAH